MYIKKREKEGFILVETILIVAVCILILNMYIKELEKEETKS